MTRTYVPSRVTWICLHGAHLTRLLPCSPLPGKHVHVDMASAPRGRGAGHAGVRSAGAGGPSPCLEVTNSQRRLPPPPPVAPAKPPQAAVPKPKASRVSGHSSSSRKPEHRWPSASGRSTTGGCAFATGSRHRSLARSPFRPPGARGNVHDAIVTVTANAFINSH